MDYSAEILMTEFVTHNVKRFVVTRPQGLNYEPGQGVELAIDEPGWQDEGRPFTPTNLKDDDVLEFVIKGYFDHDGVTQKLHSLKAGAKLLMSKPFGVLTYRGPGWFLAGGAGLTPMIAMLRHLAAAGKLDGHGLIFANNTPADIICEKELRHYLGDKCVLLCDDAQGLPYREGRVDRDVLTENITDFDQRFYTCGPPPFDKGVKQALENLGAKPDQLVFES